MPLSESQVKNLKEQILKQIENFPFNQREPAKKQVEAMNAEQLEQFLIQNNLIKPGEPGAETSGVAAEDPQGCIFCNIIENKTPSYKIAENKTAIAILDINPMSKGQSLIVPKKHETIEKLPSSVLSLSKKIAKKLKSKLKPKPEEVKIETSSIQGHGIITVLPLYKDTKPERKQATELELQKLKEKLETKSRAPRKSKAKPIKDISNLPLAPVRVP